jgi:hypothetical protein
MGIVMDRYQLVLLIIEYKTIMDAFTTTLIIVDKHSSYQGELFVN